MNSAQQHNPPFGNLNAQTPCSDFVPLKNIDIGNPCHPLRTQPGLVDKSFFTDSATEDQNMFNLNENQASTDFSDINNR